MTDARRRRHPDRRDRHRDQGLDRPQPRRSAARRSSCTRAPTPADDLVAQRPRRGLPRQRPRRPGRARLHRRHAARAHRPAAGVRHLPRPPAALAAPSAWRPSSCPSATAAPTTRSRTSRPAGSRSPRRTTASRSSGPAARGRSTPTSRCAGRPTSAPPQLSHVNLYDRTVEGLTLLDVPGGTVQYHPEAGPGPHDSLYLFDRFLDQIRRRPRSDAATRRPPQDPDPRLGPDRHRPGGRVRLLRRAGVQGPQGGGLRDRPRQLEPGDDHDRPGVRRRDVRRAAAAGPGRRRSSSASGPTRCCRRSAARRR